MATRGRIAIEMEDGSLLSIYSHWDNYPEYNGRILQTHFNDRNKVEELIDDGDISSLWTNRDWDNKEWDDDEYKTLTYAMCGENCPPRHDETLKEYLNNGEEYAYIFTRSNEWICYDLHGESPRIVEIPAGSPV